MHFNLKRGAKLSKEVKASLSYTICSIVQKVLSVVTTPLFSRLLTVEQYGQLSVYNSWSAILTIFITLNLSYGSFDKAMVKFEDDRSGYMSSIQTIAMGLGILFIGIYLPFREFFNNIFSLSTNLVFLLTIEIIAQFGLSLWFAKNRYEYKYKSVIIVTILMTILSPMSAFIFVLNSQERGIARIFGYALVYILIGGFFFIKNYFSGKKVFSKKYWKYALSFNIPLLIYYISQMIFNQSDMIIIEKLCGMEAAGLYALAYTFALLLTFVLNAITNSYIPWMYEKIKVGKHKDNPGLSIIITIIMCVLVGGVIWITPEAILLMGGENYLGSIYVVPPVSISLILLLYTSFFTNIQFYYEKKYKLIVASILAAVLNIVLNFLLIPHFGIVAAGYTTLISYVVFCLSNYLVVRKDISKNGQIEGILKLKPLIILFILFVMISYVGVILYPFPIIRYLCIGIVILALIAFRKKIVKIGKKILNNKMEISIKTFFIPFKKPIKAIIEIINNKQSIKRLKMINNKKIDIGKKINVVFIVMDSNVWNKLEPLYFEMKKNDKFTVNLVCAPQLFKDSSVTYEYFKNKGYDCIDARIGCGPWDAMGNKGEWFDLRELNPNYIFYGEPYNSYLPRPYRTNETSKYAKLCIVTYGMTLAEEFLNIRPRDFYRDIYCCYANNIDELNYNINKFKQQHNKGIQKTKYLGFVAFSDIISAKNKKTDAWNFSKNKTRIIWTPRWTTDKVLGGSNFFKYKDVLIEYAIQNKEVDLLFRPHPMALDNFIRTGEMTVEEVEQFNKLCENTKNLSLDKQVSYSSTFWDSSFLITDVSTIIIEYFITGKPIIFCESEITRQKFLPYFEKILKCCYIVKNKEELINIIELLKKGNDEKKDLREKCIVEIFGRDLTIASQNIVNDIINDANVSN